MGTFKTLSLLCLLLATILLTEAKLNTETDATTLSIEGTTQSSTKTTKASSETTEASAETTQSSATSTPAAATTAEPATTTPEVTTTLRPDIPDSWSGIYMSNTTKEEFESTVQDQLKGAIAQATSDYCNTHGGCIATTVAPTTIAPTTVAPTTVAPTTVAPTTAAQTTTPAPTDSTSTAAPTPAPTNPPSTASPTAAPTPAPTDPPSTAAPTPAPTPAPTDPPSTAAPTPAPTDPPSTAAPTPAPTDPPSTAAPTPAPTDPPSTAAPTPAPTPAPTAAPTDSPNTAAAAADPKVKNSVHSINKRPVIQETAVSTGTVDATSASVVTTQAEDKVEIKADDVIIQWYEYANPGTYAVTGQTLEVRFEVMLENVTLPRTTVDSAVTTYKDDIQNSTGKEITPIEPPPEVTTPALTTVTTSPTTTAPPPKGLEGWEIALIVIGSLAGAGILGAVIYFLFCRKSKKNRQPDYVDSWATPSNRESQAPLRESTISYGAASTHEYDNPSYETGTFTDDPKTQMQQRPESVALYQDPATPATPATDKPDDQEYTAL